MLETQAGRERVIPSSTEVFIQQASSALQAVHEVGLCAGPIDWPMFFGMWRVTVSWMRLDCLLICVPRRSIVRALRVRSA